MGVIYWELKFHLRAMLECWLFGPVWPLIWWIWRGFRPPGEVATDIRADSTLIRRKFALPRSDSTLFRHYFDIPVVDLRFLQFACKFTQQFKVNNTGDDMGGARLLRDASGIFCDLPHVHTAIPSRRRGGKALSWGKH